MRRALLAAVLGGFFISCAGITPDPHPTPAKPISGCHITCPSGYMLRRQHLCRGGSRWLEDIRITGEDSVPGDPSESRWLTGMISWGADHDVKEQLAKDGVKLGDKDYAEKYRAAFAEVEKDLGDQARAAYNKQDVELCSCEEFKRRKFNELDPSQRGVMPGEPDPLNPRK